MKGFQPILLSKTLLTNQRFLRLKTALELERGAGTLRQLLTSQMYASTFEGQFGKRTRLISLRIKEVIGHTVTCLHQGIPLYLHEELEIVICELHSPLTLLINGFGETFFKVIERDDRRTDPRTLAGAITGK